MGRCRPAVLRSPLLTPLGPDRSSSGPRSSTHVLLRPFPDRYLAERSPPDKSVSEGASTRLRDLTFGSTTSLGPTPVSRALRARASCCCPAEALSLPPLPAQGLRAFLSACPAAEPLLQRGLLRRGPALASPAGESSLAGQRAGQGPAPRAVPPRAATHPAGRSPRTAVGPRARGRVAAGDRAAGPCGVRGPAPSNKSREFRDAALPAAWLLRGLRPAAPLTAAAFLQRLVPSGFTTRARSREALASSSSARRPAASATAATTTLRRRSHVAAY
jgi:hypothetical protein